MKKITLVVIILLCHATSSFSQSTFTIYTIFFNDKANTIYSVNNPLTFLSQRALNRRTNQNINVTSHDFPVNQNYVTAVANLGAQVLNKSRWLNAISIYCTDSVALANIAALPFVSSVKAAKRVHKTDSNKFQAEEELVQHKSLNSFNNSQAIAANYNYGPSFNQISMLHGDLLHTYNFNGQGKVIAVIDAGFYKADICETFDSLRANNQILGTWDFVDRETNVYNDHYHGTYVLSIIGGNSPGHLIGTAPKASFWLLRSEDAPIENLVEEFNWVCAAEFADSVGADVINSSLGYTTFDNPIQNHTFSDLDGNTAMATRGADYAASKGIVVVNSAGNSGDNSWLRLNVPSDADSILSVAAVDSAQVVTAFSSRGYSFDGRIKPDLAAQGLATVGQIDPGVFQVGNGTSFSSPLIAGMCASLWQALPALTAQELIEAVRMSCNHYNNPDSLTGYGIPDFGLAYTLITGQKLESSAESNLISIYPNPFKTNLEMLYYSADSQAIKLQMYDVTGKQVFADSFMCAQKSFNKFKLDSANNLSNGIYFIALESKSGRLIRKVVKN